MSVNNSTEVVINNDKENDASNYKPTNDINLFSDHLNRDMKGVFNDSTKETNLHEQDRNNCNIDNFFNDFNEIYLNTFSNNFSKPIEAEKKVCHENKHLDNAQEKVINNDDKKEEKLLLNIADNMTCSEINMKDLASSEKKNISEFTNILEDINKKDEENEKTEKPKLVSKYLEELNYNNKKNHAPIFSEASSLIDISSISEETKQSVYSKLNYDFSSITNLGLNKYMMNEMENDQNKKIEHNNICDKEEIDHKSSNDETRIDNTNEIIDGSSIQKKSECSDLTNSSENESDGIDKLFNRHKIEVSNLSKYFDFHKNEIKTNIDTLKSGETVQNDDCNDLYTNLENDEIYEYGSDSSNNSTESLDEKKIYIEKREDNENKKVNTNTILTLDNLEKINKNYATLKKSESDSMFAEEDSLNLETNDTNYITNDVLNDILNIKDDQITFEKFKNYFTSLNYQVSTDNLILLFNAIVEHKKCNMKNEEVENNEINKEETYIKIDDIKSYVIERNSKNNNYFNEILKMIVHFNNILLLMANSSAIKKEDKILFELLVFKFSSSFNEIIETPNDVDNLIKHLNEIIKLILSDESKNKNLKNIILSYLNTNKISLKNNEILSQLNKSSENVFEKFEQIKSAGNAKVAEHDLEKGMTLLSSNGSSNGNRKEEECQDKAINEDLSIKIEKGIINNLKTPLNDAENNTRNLTKDIIISEINNTNISSKNAKKNDILLDKIDGSSLKSNECSEHTERTDELFEEGDSINENADEMTQERNIINIDQIKDNAKMANLNENPCNKNKKMKKNSKKNIKCKNVVNNSKIDEINSNSTNGNKKKKIKLEKKNKVEDNEETVDKAEKQNEQIKNINEICKKIKERTTACLDAKKSYMRNYTNDINMKNVQNYMKRFSSMNNTNNIPAYIIMNKNNRYINSNNAIYKKNNFLFPSMGNINDYNTQNVKLANSAYSNENKTVEKLELFNPHIFKDSCQNNFIKKNSTNENTDNRINSNQYLWNEKLRTHSNIKHNPNNYIMHTKNCKNNNTAHYKENPCLHFPSHLNSTIDNSYITKLSEDYIFTSNLSPYKNAILTKESNVNINPINKVRTTISINNTINGINIGNDRMCEQSKMILKKDGSVASTSKSDVNKNVIGNVPENNNININNEQYKIKSISNLNQFKNKLVDEKNKRYSISYGRIPNNNVYIGFRRNINNSSSKNNANANGRRNKSQSRYLTSKSDVHATINSSTNLTSEKKDNEFTKKNLSNFESGLFKLKSFANILTETNKSKEVGEKNEKESKNVYHRFTEIITNGIKRFTLGSTKSISSNITDEKENKDAINDATNNSEESNTEKDNNNTNIMIEQAGKKEKTENAENNKIEESQCINKSNDDNDKISNTSCNAKENNLNDTNTKQINNLSNNVDEIKKQTNNIINYRNSNVHPMNNNLVNAKIVSKLNNDQVGDNVKVPNGSYKNYSSNNNIINNNNNTLHTYKMHVDNPDMKYKKGYHSNVFNRGSQGLLNIKKTCSNYVNHNRISAPRYESASNTGMRSGSGVDRFIHFHKRNSTLNGAMPFPNFHEHNKNIINNIKTKGSPNEFTKPFMKRESKIDIMNNSRIINMSNNINEDIGKYIYDKDHLFLKPFTGFENIKSETNLFMQLNNDKFMTKANQINCDTNNNDINKNLKENMLEKQTNNVISSSTLKMHNNKENENRNCVLKTQGVCQNDMTKTELQNEFQNNYLKNYEQSAQTNLKEYNNTKTNSNHSTKETKFIYKDDTKYNMPTTFLKEFQKNTSNNKKYIETIDENNLTIEQIMKIPGVKLGKNYIQDINVCSDWSKFNDYDQKVIKQSIQNSFDNNNYNHFMDFTQFTNTFFSTEK
ncbi:conserved Plasmodium protein, unknown function [Plasmodium chabaudi adami]|uniref:Uncharacterized protein n=1 Tax=Plasmodium chabaudi adami TaxID=5826 RepID=A0A1C6YI60_PLACE|nr:conserved Plasmodium protein, unknown function [Plasmodium chabaudi adami]